VILGIAWPDLAIGAILAYSTFAGWRRGFISELTGAVALFAALLAAFSYRGSWDARIESVTHLAGGGAHIAGLLLAAAIAYLCVYAVGFVLERAAKLPVAGTINGMLGGVVGLGKALVFLWIVLYVALWFPLSDEFRAVLHRSALASAITMPNELLDGAIHRSFPWFQRPSTKSVSGHLQIPSRIVHD
jgi:uncharacterized membrane protein required for colicin V production